MKLTPQERELIYQEELEKRRKEKLENLTEEEREKIYQEDLPKNETTADGTMVEGPKIINDIFTVIILFLSIIVYGILGFIFAFIIILIIKLLLFLADKTLLDPILFLKCPLCKNDIHLELKEKNQVIFMLKVIV